MFGSTKKSISVSEEVLIKTNTLHDQITPLVSGLYSNKALFYISKGFNSLLEVFFYLLGLALFAFVFLMDTVFPFHVLKDINSQQVYLNASSGKGDIELFTLAVKGLVVFIGVLFIFIGFMIHKSTVRINLLQKAGQGLKATENYLIQIKKVMHSDRPSADSSLTGEPPYHVWYTMSTCRIESLTGDDRWVDVGDNLNKALMAVQKNKTCLI